MAGGWLLTLLALVGASAGVFLGRRAEKFSGQLAGAGGGLLSGISLFWLVPEIGETSGRGYAILLVVCIAAVLAALEAALEHSGHSAQQGVIWPLLMATAFHSVLDGWSVRVLSGERLTNIAVTLGLALHKIPEGAAVGWIARRSLGSARRALLWSGAAELGTLVGVFAEPAVNASGAGRFGVWWTAGALSIIGGGFLFLGFHALLPHWRELPVVMMFLAMFLLVGAMTFVRSGVV